MLFAAPNASNFHILLFVALMLFIVGAVVSFILAPRSILMAILFAGLAFFAGAFFFLV